MSFKEFRKKIKACKKEIKTSKNENKLCKICDFKHNNNDPFYFNCKSPEKVKCLIITEQPRKREDQLNFSEDSVKNDLKNPDNIRSDTIKWISENFKPLFSYSIINESGVYYWTHHTKCPSQIRKHCSKCFNKWFKENEELKLFTNLTTIISIGAVAYKGIVSISDNPNDHTFYDYFWNEIEINVKKKILEDELKIKIGNKDYTFLALPHPSCKSPLSHLLIRFKFLIDWIKNEL